MKKKLPQINYSLLSYILAALLGVALFFNNSADSRYRYILPALAFVFVTSTSCFNALTFKSYRSVLWPFILNMLFTLAFVISNEGTGNAAFFGVNDTPLTLFFMTLGLNAHWYTLVQHATSTDFAFLLINAFLSFIIPSIGYAMGYVYLSKIRQSNNIKNNLFNE